MGGCRSCKRGFKDAASLNSSVGILGLAKAGQGDGRGTEASFPSMHEVPLVLMSGRRWKAWQEQGPVLPSGMMDGKYTHRLLLGGD